MKKRLIITLFALAVSTCTQAATCPAVDSFTPDNPPVGWMLLPSPIVDGQRYHFEKAVHSLNGSFFYQQIFCVYAACPSWGCPYYELLSDDAFEKPDTKDAPWNARPPLAYTLACQPADHDPTVCQFSQVLEKPTD